MSFWNEIPQTPTAQPSKHSNAWNAGFVAVGIIVLAVTFRAYRFLEPGNARLSTGSVSAADADRQIESAKSELTAHPDDYRLWTSIALSNYAKGPAYYDEALNALDKARNLGENSEQLFYYAGVMFDTLGLADYAMAELSKYLRHHPDDYETQVRLANIYFRQKHPDEALTLYKSIIKEWPKDPMVWLNYAVVNKDKANYDAALDALQQVKKLTKAMPAGGLYQEGEIYRLQNQGDSAISAYKAELALRPEFLPALEALESVVRQKGDRKQSAELRQKILELKKQQSSSASSVKNG